LGIVFLLQGPAPATPFADATALSPHSTPQLSGVGSDEHPVRSPTLAVHGQSPPNCLRVISGAVDVGEERASPKLEITCGFFIRPLRRCRRSQMKPSRQLAMDGQLRPTNTDVCWADGSKAHAVNGDQQRRAAMRGPGPARPREEN